MLEAQPELSIPISLMIKDSISDLFLIFYPTLKRNRKGDRNRLRLYNLSVMYC